MADYLMILFICAIMVALVASPFWAVPYVMGIFLIGIVLFGIFTP